MGIPPHKFPSSIVHSAHSTFSACGDKHICMFSCSILQAHVHGRGDFTRILRDCRLDYNRCMSPAGHDLHVQLQAHYKPRTNTCTFCLGVQAMCIQAENLWHFHNIRYPLTLQHPSIVSLHYAFQTNHKLYLILEYLSGKPTLPLSPPSPPYLPPSLPPSLPPFLPPFLPFHQYIVA